MFKRISLILIGICFSSSLLGSDIHCYHEITKIIASGAHFRIYSSYAPNGVTICGMHPDYVINNFTVDNCRAAYSTALAAFASKTKFVTRTNSPEINSCSDLDDIALSWVQIGIAN